MNKKKINYSDAKKNYTLFNDTNFRVFWDYWADTNKDFSFLVYDGETSLDNLNLDNENYDNDVIGIIINGNLIANNIYNTDTDYGVHLIVLGNVTANNIVVGGQDINITGNLTVAEVFFGCYNHGSIFISGNIHCPVIIIDDYAFVTNGSVSGTVYGNECIYFLANDQSICPHPNSNLEDIFDESAFNEDDLDFTKVIGKIESKQPILSKYIFNKETDSILPEDILKWINFPKSNPSLNIEEVEKWDTKITLIRNPKIALSISEYGSTYQFVVNNDNVEVFFKDKKNKDIIEAEIGSINYRRVRRILVAKTQKIDWYFEK